MKTAKEQFKSDLQKDPEDLVREANDARKDLEGSIDELMQQFSPSELLNRGIALFQNKGNNGFIRNFSSQVENNPIPAILTVISLIWLMTASRQPAVHRESRGESLTDQFNEKTDQKLKEKQSKASPAIAGSDNGPTGKGASPKASNRPASATTGGGVSPARTGPSSLNPKPPQLNPASQGAGRDSSKT